MIAMLCISVVLLTSAPASAGLISKGAKIYTTVQIVKIGILVARYGKQLHSISKVGLSRQQVDLLKRCFVNRNCASYRPNPKEWGGTLKDKLISEWEIQTGQVWPRHVTKVYGKKGNVIADLGDRYEAHHVIPKNIDRKSVV